MVAALAWIAAVGEPIFSAATVSVAAVRELPVAVRSPAVAVNVTLLLAAPSDALLSASKPMVETATFPAIVAEDTVSAVLFARYRLAPLPVTVLTEVLRG